MHASNFRPVKRVGDAVRVFERVRSKIPAKLLLVGEGPERLFVQQLVKELKLSDDVRFLGEQDYLEEILNCADLFLLPSEQESFGLVALEAHASGVPVIATKTGGLPEVVVEGETGFLVPVGEIEDMTKKALALLTDPDLHSSFREGAKKLARERFDIHSIIPQYEEFYKEILSQ
jgi:N-acetyl-alpha-D-glucosaminyl L-malate synthase BshA